MNYIAPFVIGLLGSLHCMGMCGPIAISLPLKERSWSTRVFSSLLYNTGRILTYGFLGLLFGLAGAGLSMWGIQQWISIAAGTLMILSVGVPVMFHGSTFTSWLDRLFSGFKRGFGRLFGIRSYLSTFVIGIMNGFLPCGLVYIALAGALISNRPFEGVLYMAAFGAGTLPALMIMPLVGNLFSHTFRNLARRSVPYLVILLGILFIVRGMNLGIPYVSPKMDQSANRHPTEEIRKPECCH